MRCESFKKLPHLLLAFLEWFYKGRVGFLSEESVGCDAAVEDIFRNQTGLCEQKSMAQVHVIKCTTHADGLVLEESRTRANVRLLQLTDKI